MAESVGRIDINEVKVSTVMPIHNAEKFLGKAIESWTKQTIENKELICIDDYSEDSSLDIVKSFQSEFDNIILIQNNKNIGAGLSRNKGISVARGEYISFLDADDYYLDADALLIMYKCLEESGEKIAVAKMKEYDGTKLVDYSILNNIEWKPNCVVDYKDVQSDYYYQAYLFSRLFLQDCGVIFPDKRRGQDNPFLVETLFGAGRMVMADVDLFCHRIRKSEFHYSKEMINDLFSVFLWELQFSERNNLDILMNRAIHHINSEFFGQFYDGLQDDNFELLRMMLEARDISLAHGYSITPLDFLLWGRCGLEKRNEYLIEKRIRLEGAKRIVIYGAGTYGQIVYSIFDRITECKVVAWIDQKRCGQYDKGHKICSISEIDRFDADVIWISICDSNVSASVKGDLIDKGVSEEKIREIANIIVK